MMSRLAGALVRAILMGLTACVPALMLPDTNVDTAQIVALIAVFATFLTFFEYVSVYPGLIAFRDAPPFNRIRFLALFVMVVLLSAIEAAPSEPNTFNRLIAAFGSVVGDAFDLPYSPVRLMVLSMPTHSTFAQVIEMRNMSAIAFAISLITLMVFASIMIVRGWPLSCKTFNVWVNLPTFDPTMGGDVVERLRRDSWVNVALGFLLPFVLPALLKLISVNITPISLLSSHTLVWTVTAWVFIPVSLFMRGIAMGRVATMIERKRRAQESSGYLPA
ncbi:hypothetical protein FGG78_03855 [Thioclava sp. BHET1]|nr:hypothetical protein FGG78_03855 [Thioclava sp. BHET1]